jgi:uncharacterized protein YjbI with pentapeptide repeats
MAGLAAAVDFEGADLEGRLDFEGAEFGDVSFRGATFHGPVSFAGAVFHGDARFDSATFERTASFRGATFEQRVLFERPESEAVVPEWPEEVTFARWVDFREVTFRGPAGFGGARFEGRSRFNDAVFEAGVTFTGATFTRARTIGPMRVSGELNLDRVAFASPVRVKAAADLISCKGMHFERLGSIEVRSGAITLEEAGFGEPVTITGRLEKPQPRVLSLHQADVAHLTLADLDLRDCRFTGAHNLDGLRLEGVELPRTTGLATRRRLIADELDQSVPRERLARTYRALRKGREDTKDEPGAADFYYGEMEARRRAASGFDRFLLTLYWLTAGYGLRGWRALAALGVTVLLFAWAFDQWGFTPDLGFGKSLLFAAESTTSLFRTPGPPEGVALRDAGQVLEMGLRLLGPLFFGLALLALRGRVKR